MHTPLALKHRRERKAQSRLPTDTNARYIRLLDHATFFVGILGPFTVLPQIIQIFTTHSVAGISLSSWVYISVLEVVWVLYGLAHKNLAIIASFALWELADLFIIIGILLYR